MKVIIGYIRDYFRWVNKAVLIGCILFTAALVWLNYGQDLEHHLINSLGLPYGSITGRMLLFGIAFIVPYLIVRMKSQPEYFRNSGFRLCLVLAPVFFAVKAGIIMSFTTSADPHWNQYWNDVLHWPVRLLILVVLLFACWRLFHRGESFFGLSAREFKPSPYLGMLAIMVPLILVASTQPDFQAVYPKLKEVVPLPADATPSWFYKLLFELSYGSDFFSIEIFFRGMLVVGFMRWAGKDAILPMACFYCSIHFGKPMGECISSFFGGMLLGIVSYHTRSIYGGLIVHLGIAWLMELGGYLGNLYKW